MNLEGTYHYLGTRGSKYVSASESVRINIITRDIWIDCTRFQHIIRAVENILKASGTVPAPCMLVCGEGGSGKTSLIKKILRTSESWDSGVKSMSLIDNLGGLRFNELVMHAMGVPIYTGRSSRTIIPADATKYVQQQRIKCLIIDEMQASLINTRSEQLKHLNILKALSNEPYCLSIVAFGTAEAKSALSYDQQLARRYDLFDLSKWTLGEEFRNFLATWEQNLPLRKESKIYRDEIARVILELTGGTMDYVVKSIKWAAILAVKSGEEQITPEILRKAYSSKWGF